MKNKKEYVDKVYRLKGDKAPLAFMLASQHSKRFPLMHFDTEEGVNKPLRYAKNQKSIFFGTWKIICQKTLFLKIKTVEDMKFW